jgi:hypothetical protein
MDEPPLRVLYHRIGQALDLRESAGSRKGVIKICTYSPELVTLRLKDGRKWLQLDFVESDGRIHASISVERKAGFQHLLPGVDYVSECAKSDLLKLNDALDGALPHFFDEAIRTFLAVEI